MCGLRAEPREAHGEGTYHYHCYYYYCYYYLVFLINRAGILENLGSNMGQKSVWNHLFNPFGGLGSVRNGFAIYFSCRLSPSMLRTASKWSQNQLFPLNRSGTIKEKHRVLKVEQITVGMHQTCIKDT